jgi:hypothetical protein
MSTSSTPAYQSKHILNILRVSILRQPKPRNKSVLDQLRWNFLNTIVYAGKPDRKLLIAEINNFTNTFTYTVTRKKPNWTKTNSTESAKYFLRKLLRVSIIAISTAYQTRFDPIGLQLTNSIQIDNHLRHEAIVQWAWCAYQILMLFWDQLSHATWSSSDATTAMNQILKRFSLSDHQKQTISDIASTLGISNPWSPSSPQPTDAATDSEPETDTESNAALTFLSHSESDEDSDQSDTSKRPSSPGKKRCRK